MGEGAIRRSAAEERRWRLVQGGTLVGLVVAGGIALRPVQVPESGPQSMLQRASLLRQAVAREPDNASLLLQLARAEFAAAQLAALRDYNARFPEVSPEPPSEQRVRYESWLRGHLHASREARAALAHARRAARQAPAAPLRSDALLLAGSVSWHRGEERRALNYFRRACRAWPASIAAWRRLAAAAAELEETRLSAYARRRLEQLQPEAVTDDSPEASIPERPRVAPGAAAAPSPPPSTRRQSDTRRDPAAGA